MKRFVTYFLFFIFICFVLPALLTKQTKSTSVKEVEEVENSKNVDTTKKADNYEYKQFGTIKLLHTKTNEVEEVALDDYLCNVVSAEMPASYSEEALKAQAIVARTYTIYKANNKKHEQADICDSSTCCQAWISKEDRLNRWEEDKRDENWQKIGKCVNDTKGQIITYNNSPINAFFHSNSGGTTETPKEVWGGTNYPYLQVVQTAGEEGYTQYSSEVKYTNEELLNKLKTKYSDIQIDFNNNDDIKILEYTDSNRVKTIKFGNHNLSGVETRTILGLKSANFEFLKDNQTITFKVKGYGHGVGMSQTGADAMAKEGKNANEIINHFYTNIEIKDINSL